jgi:16S rRNA (cytosine967-C5)-methyltransferase
MRSCWREPVLDADPQWRLVEQTSCGPPLLEHWRSERGSEEAARLAYHGLVQAPLIVTGVEDPGPGCTPHSEPGFHVFNGPREALDALLKSDERIRVQDPAAAAAVAATADLEPRVIIDACAGKGTKTRQLHALHPNAEIVATDVDPRRHEVLRRSFEGVDGVHIVEPEGLRPWAGRSDLVLLDVPCSNTGVLARRVEAKYRFSDETLASLNEVQQSIIETTMPLLAPGGRVLYTTCSIEAGENERLAERAAGRFGLGIEQTAHRLPQGQPGEAPTSYSDGGFFALLRK